MPQVVGNGDADRPGEGGRLVERPTHDLRPHPTYQMLSAPTVAGRIRRIAQQPGAIREPLHTTTTGIILDGCARWQVALDRRQAMLPCLEYPLTDEAALVSVIRHHRGAAGLNDFCRILMSLELEPSFKRWGSQLEPASSSNLTNVMRRDVRADLARIAGASTGNITKVKQILETAIPEIRDALICGQLRIHRAWLWRTLEPKAQRAALWQHLNRRAMEQKIVRLVNAHAAKVSDSVPIEDSKIAAEVARRLGMPDASNLTVAVVEVPGKALVLTREFCEELRRKQVV